MMFTHTHTHTHKHYLSRSFLSRTRRTHTHTSSSSSTSTQQQQPKSTPPNELRRVCPADPRGGGGERARFSPLSLPPMHFFSHLVRRRRRRRRRRRSAFCPLFARAARRASQGTHTHTSPPLLTACARARFKRRSATFFSSPSPLLLCRAGRIDSRLLTFPCGVVAHTHTRAPHKKTPSSLSPHHLCPTLSSPTKNRHERRLFLWGRGGARTTNFWAPNTDHTHSRPIYAAYTHTHLTTQKHHHPMSEFSGSKSERERKVPHTPCFFSTFPLAASSARPPPALQLLRTLCINRQLASTSDGGPVRAAFRARNKKPSFALCSVARVTHF